MEEILDDNSKAAKLWYQKTATMVILETILLLIGSYYFCTVIAYIDLPQVPDYLAYTWIIAIMLFYAITPFFKPYIILDSNHKIILGIWNLAHVFVIPLILLFRFNLKIPATISLLCYFGLQSIVEAKYSTSKTPLPIFLFYLGIFIISLVLSILYFVNPGFSENHFILLFLIIMILQSTSLISMIAYLLLEPKEHSAYWYYIPRQVAILSNLLLLYYFSF